MLPTIISYDDDDDDDDDVATDDALRKRFVTHINPATEADVEFRHTSIDW